MSPCAADHASPRTVDGNVESYGARSGDVTENTVHGDFVASHTEPSPYGFGFDLYGPPDEIDGSLYFLDNRGPTEAEGNTIRRNLVCLGSRTPPATEGGNQVGGREVGQCAGDPNEPEN